MNKLIYFFLLLCLVVGCSPKQSHADRFIRISGPDLITPDGKKFLIQGINLGNWLNPEGYMFRFENTNSYRLINDAFCEMV